MLSKAVLHPVLIAVKWAKQIYHHFICPVSELHLFASHELFLSDRQRKDELEQRMSALQESRRELMVQLEGLMKLLKVRAAARLLPPPQLFLSIFTPSSASAFPVMSEQDEAKGLTS